MSYFPPPLPPSMMPPPLPAQQSEFPAAYELPPKVPANPLRTLICWVLILGSMAAIISMVVRGDDRRNSGEMPGAGIQLEIISRYAVGVHVISDRIAQQGALDMQVRSNATSNLDRLRTIPVIGALNGDKQAVTEANRMLFEALPQQIHDDVRLMRRLYAHGSKSISKADRDGLIERHGWFGELAVSHDAPAGDPLRESVEHTAIRAVVAVFAALGFVLFGLIAGLTLLIVILVQFGSGRLQPRYRPASGRVSDVMLEGFAVLMVVFVMMEVALRRLPSGAGLVWNALLIVPYAVGVLWLRVRGIGWSEMADSIGWRRGEGVLREMMAGVAAYFAGLPILVVAGVITALLTKFAGTTVSHPIVNGIHSSLGVQLFLVFLACIFAPVTEETFFRGVLLGHLRFRHRWVVSALVVSLIFAAIHPQGWTAIPLLGTIAMTLAVLREQRGSLIGPMTMHALNNTVIITLLLLTAG